MGIVKEALNFSSFFLSFLSFKAVFVFSGVSSSLGSPILALLQPAIRTRVLSVPNDDSESVKRNECAQSNLGVQTS